MISDTSAVNKSLNKNYNELPRKIFHIVLPFLLINIGNTVCNFITINMLTKYDASFLKAASIIISVQTTIIVVSTSILLVVGNFTSQANSSNENEKVGIIYRQSLLASILISLCALLVLLFIKPILLILKQPEFIILLCGRYFKYYMFSLPAVFSVFALQQLLSGLKKQNIIILISIISPFLFYLIANNLTCGFLSVPTLEVEGAAMSFTVYSWIIFIFYQIYIYKKSELKKYNLFKVHNWKNEVKELKLIFKIGSSISLMLSGEIGAFFFLNVMAGWLDEDALLIQSIATQFLFLSVTLILPLAESASILIGDAVGSKYNMEIRRYGNLHILIGVYLSAFFLFSFLLFSRAYASIFIDLNEISSSLYNQLKLIFIINAVGQIFDAIRNITMGSLRGIHDTFSPMIISISCLWLIGLPIAYLTTQIYKIGIMGIALGDCIALGISIIPILHRWHTKTNLFEKNVQEADVGIAIRSLTV